MVIRERTMGNCRWVGRHGFRYCGLSLAHVGMELQPSGSVPWFPPRDVLGRHTRRLQVHSRSLEPRSVIRSSRRASRLSGRSSPVGTDGEEGPSNKATGPQTVPNSTAPRRSGRSRLAIRPLQRQTWEQLGNKTCEKGPLFRGPRLRKSETSQQVS